MKTANSILVSYVTVVLLGCGGDDNTPAGPADGTAPQDSTTLDTSPIDAGVADTQKDVLDASTAPSHPANWSIMVGHGVRACGYEVEVDAPSMIGATPIKKGLSYVSLFADGGVQSVTQLKTTGHLADCDLAEGPDTIDQFVNGNSSTSYQVTGAAMRGRLDTNTRAFITFDSMLTGGDACQITQGQPCSPVAAGSVEVVNRSFGKFYGNRIRPSDFDAGLAAADSVSFAGASQFFVLGRLEKNTFDFDYTQVGAVVASAPAVFLASYRAPVNQNGTVTADWVRAFPTTTVPSIKLGNQNDEPFFGPHLENGTGQLILTIPFANTLDLGVLGKLNAPNNSYATALVTTDYTGKPLLGVAFAKGPASQGKVSRARITDLKNGTYLYVDTVWDTIDLGNNAVVNATNGGADVLVAVLDGSGKALKYWTYGGAGDDEVFGAMGTNAQIVVWAHSTGTIDLGNGVLSGPGIWYAGITP